MTSAGRAGDTDRARIEPAVPPSAPLPAPRWYRLRWRVLLLVPLAIVLVAAVVVPRQLRQARAIREFKRLNVVVRTQPTPLLGLELLIPPEYADEVIEVYWRDPKLDESQLRVLRGLSTVEKIELAGSPVTSHGLLALRGLSQLYMLHLDDTRVDDTGLVELARLKNLEVLSLGKTLVTDAGLAHLERLPRLERLYLDETAVTDAGLARLGTLVNLKELSLVDTQISDAGLKHLQGLKNLEMLKVYNTLVTKQAMHDFHAAVPKCVVWIPTE
jgi:Leucine Rich repeat